MSINLRQVLFAEYRIPAFLGLTTVISTIALRPDATSTPLIVLLSVLLTYFPLVSRSDDPYRGVTIGLTGLFLAFGSAISRIQASKEALSSTAESVVWLSLLSSILSAFSIGALYASTKFSTRLSSSWSQATLFPTIWATLWCTVSYISPIGHLSTWSPASNTDAYSWITPFLGPVVKDWIIGAWAVVISQTITSWYMGPRDSEEDLDLLSPQPQRKQSLPDNTSARKLLALILVALAAPSFYFSGLPLPVSEIDTVTPLTVGCVIPPYQRYKHHTSSLDDYIEESKKMTATKVLLWPEGAVVFHTEEEKQAAFKRVRDDVRGPYVGVSFEETITDPDDPSGRKGLTRTGLALISQNLDEPHFVYYKRNLVPVAESYRLKHSTEPPTIFDVQLPKPKNSGISNTEWSPNANHTRAIPISASICLDFATPSPFSALSSRPGLILAPARTWDRTVGNAMWLQAKQRAEELGSMVLWCDGGQGGVSGVGGAGFNDVTQVGAGSWVQTIGIQYPFNTNRTPFARFGELILVFLWLLVFGPGNLLNRRTYQFGQLQHGIGRAVNMVRGRRSTPSPLIEEPRDLLG